MAARKKKSEAEQAQRQAREDVLEKYREVYQRCMQDDPKSFDAKGALSALDQISRLLGVDTPEHLAEEERRVILTLGDGVGERGD